MELGAVAAWMSARAAPVDVLRVRVLAGALDPPCAVTCDVLEALAPAVGTPAKYLLALSIVPGVSLVAVAAEAA